MDQDTTDYIMHWATTEFGGQRDDDVIKAAIAGIGIGLALSELAPEYAKLLYVGMTEDFKHRTAGSEFLYEAMSIAEDEKRTGYEILADNLFEAITITDTQSP